MRLLLVSALLCRGHTHPIYLFRTHTRSIRTAFHVVGASVLASRFVPPRPIPVQEQLPPPPLGVLLLGGRGARRVSRPTSDVTERCYAVLTSVLPVRPFEIQLFIK